MLHTWPLKYYFWVCLWKNLAERACVLSLNQQLPHLIIKLTTGLCMKIKQHLFACKCWAIFCVCIKHYTLYSPNIELNGKYAELSLWLYFICCYPLKTGTILSAITSLGYDTDHTGRFHKRWIMSMVSVTENYLIPVTSNQTCCDKATFADCDVQWEDNWLEALI